MPTIADVRAHIEKQLAPLRIQYPGDGSVELNLRPLTEGELDDVKLAAQRFIKDRGFDVGIDIEAYDRERVRQVLVRACGNAVRRDEQDYVQFFPTIDEVRKLDPNTVNALWRSYCDLVDSRAFQIEVPEEKAEEVVDALAAQAAEGLDLILAHYEPDRLRALVRILVTRLAPPKTSDA